MGFVTLEDATGSVSTAQTTSDDEALASTTWTLGTTSGEKQLTAAQRKATSRALSVRKKSVESAIAGATDTPPGISWRPITSPV